MDNITVSLSLNEWQTALNAIGNGPFNQVADLVAKIVQQVRAAQVPPTLPQVSGTTDG